MSAARTPVRFLSLFALSLAPVGSGVALAARLDLGEIHASSTYPPEEGASYDAARLSDGKISTAWVEGDEGSGKGAYIELKLPAPVEVRQVKVWAGMWYSQEFWQRANRPKTLELLLSDGSKKICELTDEMTAQTCEVGATTASIRLTIRDTYDGTTWLDTAISELQLFDANQDGIAPISTTAESSKLASDADGSYAASNTTDGVLDTMWCEGNKEGDGVGEWIALYFDKPRSVSKLTLVNGIGGSVKYWMLGNRATKATLQFEDGSTQKIEIKNSARPQTIPFEAQTTRNVKITFDEVYKGKEYNDLCISEAYFSE